MGGLGALAAAVGGPGAFATGGPDTGLLTGFAAAAGGFKSPGLCVTGGLEWARLGGRTGLLGRLKSGPVPSDGKSQLDG